MRSDDNVTIFFRAIAISLCIAIIVVALLYGGWLYLTKDLTGEVYSPNISVDIDDGYIYENDVDGLKNKIKDWQNNGQPAKDDNVLNILLIGIDVETSNMQKNSRADAMMLISINHEKKTITLASILRDQYCYMENNGKESFEKLHHANNYGGPKKQIELIERYYKVSIDNYALVNFYSLPKIIDKMGGVKVNITKTEKEYMNTYWGTKVKTGENVLDGATALIYMRIRHQTGGDTARVSRQQQVVKSVMNEVKHLNKTELVSLMTEIIKYVRTGYTSDEILSLAVDALLNGWFNYNINQLSFPEETYAKGETIDGSWYWKVDFPIAAQKMQTALYGKTNIILLQNRNK